MMNKHYYNSKPVEIKNALAMGATILPVSGRWSNIKTGRLVMAREIKNERQN